MRGVRRGGLALGGGSAFGEDGIAAFGAELCGGKLGVDAGLGASGAAGTGD